MRIEKLITNIIDQIKEAQIKLGYVKETVRLYYPVSSLNAILGIQAEDAREMAERLTEYFSTPDERLGGLRAAVSGGRVEISVPPEGAEYVHQKVKNPAFLTALIGLFQSNHNCTVEEVRAVFEAHGRYLCEKMEEGSDFDYVMYFADPSIDEYYYCIKAEMGHTIYHRFTKEDYEQLF